jgi:AraC-like DNA-binding protein
MARVIRVFDGRYGRLQLLDAAGDESLNPAAEPQIVVRHSAGESVVIVENARIALSREKILFLNPGVPAAGVPEAGALRAQLLVLQLADSWLHARFPAVFDGASRPFPAAEEPVTPRIRQLADTLAVEALNDQFLSPERLEFMLEELTLSIAETYLGTRRENARVWRGSPLADSRIRRALALLRAKPNKDTNMDELATQVGLSRSRFYDLFHLCTGRSPRAYLDLLCVESAIAKLSGGEAKIADVSAELGFSAQSNFTRFFQHQVGIPPSEYRRVAAKPPAKPEDPEQK